jgi:hypothetical protein
MATDFESLVNMPFRWLKAGDQLFAEADGGNAAITKDPFSRMVFMIDGYKQAGDLLVKKAIQSQTDRPLLVYPIVFCHRQCLELSLKYVITVYGRHAGVAPINKEHDLSKLWPHFRKVLEHYGPGDDGALEALKACVGEFAKVDPSSFKFRYATDTKGVPFEISVSSVGLEQLRDTMTAVANYFTGTDGYLDHLSGAVPDC